MKRENRSPPERRAPARIDDHFTGPSNDRNSIGRWIILEGRRLRIALGVSIGIFLLFLGLGVVGFIGISNTSLVTGLFSAAITGVFTLVSITISINQVILSRILGSPKDIQERADSVHQFRTGVAEMDSQIAVSPIEPWRFLSVINAILHGRADALEEAYDESREDGLSNTIEYLVETIQTQAETTDAALESNDRHLFWALLPILNDQYSKYLHIVRRISAETPDQTESERRALSGLAEILEEIDRSRHYFKTLYIHEELATVSQLMLATGVPAILVCFAVVLIPGGSVAEITSSSVGLLVVSAAIAIVTFPLAILFSYGLRLAAIAKRTTTVGTFTLVEEMD